MHSGFGPPLVVSAGYSIAPAAPFRTHSDESGTPAVPSADHCLEAVHIAEEDRTAGSGCGRDERMHTRAVLPQRCDYMAENGPERKSDRCG